MKFLLSFLLGMVWVFPAQTGWAQNQSLPIAPEVQAAIEKGTRTLNGEPGPNYFQNRSDYRIQAKIDPQTNLLSGQVHIDYQNNSPDALDQLVIRLYQDKYKKGFQGDDAIAEEDRTDGVAISKFLVNGQEMELTGEKSLITRKGTNLFLDLIQPLASGDKISLDIDWQFRIPRKTRIRMGQYGEYSYFIAYWFPQIAVYDDVYGWDTFDYTGLQEFYNDFGDFEVAITVPDSFIVWATGVLQNPDELLAATYLERYRKAMTSDEVIEIVSQQDLDENKAITQTSPEGTHTWTFKADYVPDFAFATADYYRWDATSAVINEAGERVFVDACYKSEARDFYEVAAFSKEIIEDLSTEIPGIPFPYPKMTVYNGDRSGGGMEYPMMVNDASVFNRGFAFNLTYHEIAHTYFPFYMGINERRFAWMDEGWASFLPEDMMVKKGFQAKPMGMNTSGYAGFARTRKAKPLMTPSVELNGQAYGVASYFHPATAYYVLRDILGEETFRKAMKAYIARWHGKHPGPYDFFFTFNELSGQDLSWYWKPWFFEAGVPDLALSVKKSKGRKVSLSVINQSDMPLPIHLVFTLKDGSKEVRHYSAEVWKSGKESFEVTEKFAQAVSSIKMGDSFIPDTNSRNNRWRKE